jgi:hypothetical protein
MRIDAHDRFWAVIDPTEESTHEDICWKTTIEGLANWVHGGESKDVKGQHMALYAGKGADKAAARDADRRLLDRDENASSEG